LSVTIGFSRLRVGFRLCAVLNQSFYPLQNSLAHSVSPRRWCQIGDSVPNARAFSLKLSIMSRISKQLGFVLLWSDFQFCGSGEICEWAIGEDIHTSRFGLNSRRRKTASGICGRGRRSRIGCLMGNFILSVSPVPVELIGQELIAEVMAA